MSAYPHVEWIDLYNNGQLHEVAVVKRDHIGNIYFIALRDLDIVDKRRIAGILSNRNAASVELYELLSQITLGNGVNALEYFHQLVKVRGVNGHVEKPQVGRISGPGVHATPGLIQAPQAQQVAPQAAPQVAPRRAPPAAKK
ncbi:hypothetical protein D3C75_505270 [compost metagenome]